MGRPGRALTFILLLGLVSFFSDVACDGARSISGQYLAVLGASGAVVSAVAGFGECIGHGFRLGSGYFIDRTGLYWACTLFGYGLNLIIMPLLALSGRWEAAAALFVLERFSKAVRTPPRDVMLSFAADVTGRGRGFGLHEFFDRMGAVFGPLLIIPSLMSQRGYAQAFWLLTLPAAVALVTLVVAKSRFPDPKLFVAPRGAAEISPAGPVVSGFSKPFWYTIAALSCSGAGTVDFSLVGFHLQGRSLFSVTAIPLLFSAAMVMNSLMALLVGRLYDVFGRAVLIVSLAVATVGTPLVFLGGPVAVFCGILLWSTGLAAQNAAGKALVADLVPADRRGAAFGVFHVAFGIFWFLGSACMGIMYDISLSSMVIFSVFFQATACLILMQIVHRRRNVIQK